ncbi:MAG: hypothetical protein ACM3ZQ_02220 [Bacillota bacterium]
MSLLKRLQTLDRRVIYVVLLIFVAWPILAPFKLPLGVSRETKAVYDYIAALKEGDVVALSFDYAATGYSEMHPQAVAVMEHLMAKPGLKILNLAFWEQGPMFAKEILDKIDTHGKKYGEDFVNLGYIPGGETAMSAFAADIQKAFPKDYTGKNTSDLPMMAKIKTAKDIKLLITIAAGSPGVPEFVRQVQGPYGTKFAAGLTAISVPITMPYMNSGQMVGLMGGLRGAAEYEVLNSKPSSGVVAMDAMSASHLVMIFFILLGNVAYFLEKRAQSTK